MPLRLVTALLWLVAFLPGPAMAEVDWPERLAARLVALEATFPGELGVHVRDLQDDTRFGWRDEESWYLASLIKIPVAIELMHRVESGELSLAERLELHESDYVDGAGPTNWAPPGAELTLYELLESMLTVSDNTATDMLIRHLGRVTVNRRAGALSCHGLGPITTLVDVRRHVYAGLHPDAFSLDGLDFIELRKLEHDSERLDWLMRRLDIPLESLRLDSLDAAFDAYYASGMNAGSLEAVADLLADLSRERALGMRATAELMAAMTRTISGKKRLKAGFGPKVRFAHKTGTQRRRACDAGIATVGEGAALRRFVVVACTRGAREVARSERALAEIGLAIRQAGVLDETR